MYWFLDFNWFLSLNILLTQQQIWFLIFVITETKVCTSEEFTCKSANGECIPLAWMCDQNRDCSDGSDEAQCSKYFILLYKREKKLTFYQKQLAKHKNIIMNKLITANMWDEYEY